MFRYTFPSITKLVNYFLSEGFVPDSFKKTVVTQLIKYDSLPHYNMMNYRILSDLGFTSKLVELVVACQMIDRKNSNGLDNKNQSAYKVGHSIKTALLSLMNGIQPPLSKGEASALVFLDQPAIFDTSDHLTLLSCLHSLALLAL